MDVQLNPITPQVAGVQRGAQRQGKGKGFQKALKEQEAEEDARSEAAKQKRPSSASTAPKMDSESGERASSGDGKGLKVNLLA